MRNSEESVSGHIHLAAGLIQTATYGDMDANSLHRLSSFVELGRVYEMELKREAKHARDMGETWAAIGGVFGITRQAAQQRFS